MQFPSALIFGLLIQSAVAEPGHVSQQPGGCPAGQTTRINGQCPTGSFGPHGGKCPTGSVPPQSGKCPASYKPCNLGHLSRRYEGNIVPRDGGLTAGLAALGCCLLSAWCCMLCCCGPPKKGSKSSYTSGFVDGWVANNIVSTFE
ncbi:hypothetical protein M0657_011494 [Pyricularia oryzae]|nr:hypothetical protein M9X92_011520 [Pyricularia oryzae]KAI7910159.1 hypothetical protein M0657_011494 [Pyricularia oryzae]